MPKKYLFTSLDEIFKSSLAIIWKGRDESEESFNLIFNFIKDLGAQSKRALFITQSSECSLVEKRIRITCSRIGSPGGESNRNIIIFTRAKAQGCVVPVISL